MKYETWSINQELIKEAKINEGMLKKSINLLMGKIQTSLLNCSGRVIAYKKKGHDWTYNIEAYSTELPYFMERMYFKGPELTLYVIATIRELGNAALQQRPLNELGKAAIKSELGCNVRPLKIRFMNVKNGLET